MPVVVVSSYTVNGFQGISMGRADVARWEVVSLYQLDNGAPYGAI